MNIDNHDLEINKYIVETVTTFVLFLIKKILYFISMSVKCISCRIQDFQKQV